MGVLNLDELLNFFVVVVENGYIVEEFMIEI